MTGTKHAPTLPAVLLLAALAPALCPRASAAPALDDLAFMAGCFRGSAPDGSTLEERFSHPWAGMMLATSQYVMDGRTVFFELHRIEESPASTPGGKEGKVVFWPQPGGKPTVGFTLVSVKEGVATFENLEHDFPRRFVYSKTADGYTAHLEGEEKGKARSEDYTMRRIPCEERAVAAEKSAKSTAP